MRPRGPQVVASYASKKGKAQPWTLKGAAGPPEGQPSTREEAQDRRAAIPTTNPCPILSDAAGRLIPQCQAPVCPGTCVSV